MKKSIITYGIIAGSIVSLMLFLSFGTFLKNSEYGELIGYSTMIVAFATIFFAIRSFRDTNLGGNISFSEGLKLGLGITLVATVMYVLAWMIISNTIAKDFMTEYFQQSVEKLQASDLSQMEIDKKIEEMEKFNEMYKNPFVKIGITFLEIFPVGFLVTLVSAFLLKRNKLS
jgi:pheromone shutdown protein TraB